VYLHVRPSRPLTFHQAEAPDTLGQRSRIRLQALDPCHSAAGEPEAVSLRRLETRPLAHRTNISTRLTGVLARALLVCVVFLLVGLGSISDAQAHPQPHLLPQVETVPSAASAEACCHDIDSEAPAGACAPAVCCPALASLDVSPLIRWNRKAGSTGPAFGALVDSLSSPPPLHPPAIA